MLRRRVVGVAAAIISENSELIFRHHVGIRLCLDSTPDVADVPFKQVRDRRRDLASLALFGYLKRLGKGEVICGWTSHAVDRKNLLVEQVLRRSTDVGEKVERGEQTMMIWLAEESTA